METNPDIDGKTGPRFAIEFPPPIPEKTKKKEKANGQRAAVSGRRAKTERISEAPPPKEAAEPPPIPSRTEPKATTGPTPDREDNGKTSRIAEPPSDERSENRSRRGSANSTRANGPRAINPGLVAIVLLLAGFVAFFIIVSIKATTSSNPSSVAYSPASSTAQESDTPPPGPQASNTPIETPSPTPASPNATPDASTGTSDTKADENEKRALAKFQEGLDAGKQGKYRKSIVAYQKALQIKSDFPEAWSNIGWDYSKEGATRSAVKAYKQAVEMKPDLADAWNGLAVCYARNADAKNANLAVQNLERLDSERAMQLLGSFSADFVAKIAVVRYPSLGVLNSPLNVEYRRQYDYYKANRPDYFSSSNWPLMLANEVYEENGH